MPSRHGRLPAVRLVVARCQVDYAGRLTAHLPMATRLIMVKNDGSVLVHSDGGSYKPLNWMSPPCTVVEGVSEDGAPRVAGHRQGRSTRCGSCSRRCSTTATTTSGSTPACRRTASRSTSRSCWPSTRRRWPTGLTLVRREFPTAIGPVDLMCRDAEGRSVAVEIKRRGEIDGVEQLTRYLRAAQPRPAAAAGARHLRGPGDQAAGAGARHRPRHQPARSSTTTRCGAWTTPSERLF